MDATTFMQMQQEAQAQIDALNAQIATLTQTKNDLVNTNNTSITTTQAQCTQMVSDATTQASSIVLSANTNAQGIIDAANKSKADADQYIASQQATITALNDTLKQGQDDLATAQANAKKQSDLFNASSQKIIAQAIAQANAVKAFLDTAIENINALGSPSDA